ncbi:MAG: hypothetical protein N3E39_00435 [Candidatus Methanomethylicia archaeon]|nr:hypothetical protein [Candidatus Methanomethylicia archaeon]
MAWLKRVEIPIAITIIFALIQIIPYFIEMGKPVEDFQTKVVSWSLVVGSGALFIGAISLLLIHIPRVTHRRQHWEYSVMLIAFMFMMVLLGLPIREIGLGLRNYWFMFLYDNVLIPLSSSMYGILAFYITSAAYRAFKARSLEAGLLLLAGSILVFRNAPLGTFLIPASADIGDWVFNVPNMAVNRAIMIGGGLGALILGIRTLMGYERGYLRGG